jgi:hypothetical protein
MDEGEPGNWGIERYKLTRTQDSLQVSVLENLLWAAPPTGPYAKFTQLLGPPFDFQQGGIRGGFD